MAMYEMSRNLQSDLLRGRFAKLPNLKQLADVVHAKVDLKGCQWGIILFGPDVAVVASVAEYGQLLNIFWIVLVQLDCFGCGFL
jgi:hypothetical protein